MRLITSITVLAIGFLSHVSGYAAPATLSAPDRSLQRLKEGNERFVSGKMQKQDLAKRRVETESDQAPFAVILGCSDSRVPPEVVFDEGVGDLFVVRLIGNVVGLLAQDSVEYAVHVLKSPLVVVLGHQSCGAVKAVIDGRIVEEDEVNVAPFILPAVRETKNLPGDHLTNSIKANVGLSVKALRASPVIGPMIAAGTVKIVGGYYNLASGKIEFFDCPDSTGPKPINSSAGVK